MGRLVDPKPKEEEGRLASAPSNPTSDYLERIARYVPTEIVAGYIAINGLLSSSPAHLRAYLLGGNFILCVVLTPLYLKKMAQMGQPKLKHILVSIIAFPCWAYAVGGDAGLFGAHALGWYNSYIASSLLIAFSLISGLIVPRPGEQ